MDQANLQTVILIAQAVILIVQSFIFYKQYQVYNGQLNVAAKASDEAARYNEKMLEFNKELVEFNRYMKEQKEEESTVKIEAFAVVNRRIGDISFRGGLPGGNIKTTFDGISIVFSNFGQCPISVVDAIVEDRRTEETKYLLLDCTQLPCYLVPGKAEYVSFTDLRGQANFTELFDLIKENSSANGFYVCFTDSRKQKHESSLA